MTSHDDDIHHLNLSHFAYLSKYKRDLYSCQRKLHISINQFICHFIIYAKNMPFLHLFIFMIILIKNSYVLSTWNLNILKYSRYFQKRKNKNTWIYNICISAKPTITEICFYATIYSSFRFGKILWSSAE